MSLCFAFLPYLSRRQSACAIWSPVASPAVQYFSTLSLKRHDFRKKSYWTQNGVFFDFSVLLSQTFLILIRIRGDINVHTSSCKVPFTRFRFWLNLSFLCGFFFLESPQIPNLMKFRLVGTELSHADGRTDRQIDMPKLTFAFRNFANEPKNRYQLLIKLWRRLIKRFVFPLRFRWIPRFTSLPGDNRS